MWLKISMLTLAFLAVSWLLLESCNPQSAEKQLAKKYCSSCHLFPEPSLLDKKTWQKNILPVMGPMLGIRYFLDSAYEASKYDKTQSKHDDIISIEDWKKIIHYYAENAPATDLPQNRPPVKEFTQLFTAHTAYTKASVAIITYIKIDDGNKRIYAANATDSSLYIYNNNLQLQSAYNIHGVIADMQYNENLKDSGARSGIITNIGIMNPTDISAGTVDTFIMSNEGTVTQVKQLLNNMPRPVQTTMTDIDNDGKQDYLVCGFGDTKGALYWLKNLGNNTYQQNFIRALPGAIKTYINDFNHDGLPDVMALMTQAQEGIYLFTNRGNGTFDSKTILEFPSVYGSSYFELYDFNNDGYKDILYTCGDNADYSYSALKNYHGIYIFMNDGKDNFTQQYFFPMYGCYKAIAGDFDNDGDADIAAISFFPDTKNHPGESFVYLENKGTSYFQKKLQFEPYCIKNFKNEKWLTMDAGDIDGDGDEDIVLGNFTTPQKEMQPSSANTNNAAFVLLENKTNHTK